MKRICGFGRMCDRALFGGGADFIPNLVVLGLCFAALAIVAVAALR